MVLFCVDFIACCSVSDFPGFVARQLDNSRSIYSKLRPTSRISKREVFKHILSFMHDTCQVRFCKLSVRLSPSLQKHVVQLAPIMSVFTTRQNLIKECHLTLHVNIRRMTGISSDFIFVLLVFEDNRYSILADTRVCLSTCLSVCLSIYTGLWR